MTTKIDLTRDEPVSRLRAALAARRPSARYVRVEAIDLEAAFAAPPVEVGEDIHAILRDLMEETDWVGTGSEKSGESHRQQYERRIEAALRSAAPALAPCDCYADHAPECASMGRSAAPPVEVGDPLRAAAQEAVDAWDASVVNGDVEPAIEALRAALAAPPVEVGCPAHDGVYFHGCDECARYRSEAALRSTAPALVGGTETNCSLEGVHEHPFRGPHRFREWEPGT